jgi:hypothetical protein
LTPDLDVTVSTGDPSNTLFAELVDPSGEVASAANNGLLATTAGGEPTLEPETGAQLHARNLAPGMWTLIIDFYNTVSGTAVAQPFTVTASTSPPDVAASGLPQSPAVHLPAGVPVTAHVTVTNTGNVPEEYFTDARLSKSVTLNLAPQTTSQLQLPNLAGIVPLYLVPPSTTKLSAKVSAKAANFFDISYTFGDPDLISSTGKTSSLTFSASDIPNGDWSITPFLKGPDGAKGAKAVNANVSLSATTAPVDPTVSSPTGDLWAASTNVSAAFTPYLVEPGQSVTIPVTITPEGKAGTTVTGTLSLDDVWFNPGLVTSNELFGAFPTSSTIFTDTYVYTIGS